MTCYVVDPSDKASVDGYKRWCIEGLKSVYSLTSPNSAVGRLKRLLPSLAKPYPFTTDMCGYVVMTRPVPKNTFGQGTDSQGRDVFVVGPWFLFSRYGTGELYVVTDTWIDSSRPNFYTKVEDSLWPKILELAEKSALDASVARLRDRPSDSSSALAPE